MSQQLISRSPDLKRLRDDGFDIEIRANYLLMNVPYVNSAKEIKRGILVSELTLAGDVTAAPSTHVVDFAGEHPCDADGSEIAKIKHQSIQKQLDKDLAVQHSFSSKPPGGYKDYYDKMATYAAIISSPAHAIDPSVRAQTFPVIEADEVESPFNYFDTASSRADINMATRKLELRKVAIVGIGGTGSYVLDLVAKTPVREIHLFDGDDFLLHNAFRSPGAPSIEELRKAPKKVAHFKELYSKMHRGIVAHPYYVDGGNVEQLREMDFVFLCGGAKNLIVEKLEAFGTPFVDVGMGIYMADDSLGGILRVTTSTPAQREHVRAKNRIPFSTGDGKNDYDRNIQIADLNALNAALAVIKWKKIFGFYLDLGREHHTTYTIDGNMLINEDKP